MTVASIKAWLLAARPKTLLAAVAPVLVGCVLAIADGHFHGWAVGLALLGAVAIQIGTNFCNDCFDFKQGADTEARQGPTRAVQAGWISPRAMGWATATAFSIAALAAGLLSVRAGWPVLLLGIAGIGCGIWYTAGRWSLAYLGIADLFVVGFFGIGAVVGTYYVQALTVSRDAWIAGLGPGLISTAILAVNNLRDINEDRAAGKKTLAVRFGRRTVRVEYTLCMLGGWMTPAVLGVPWASVFGLLAMPLVARVWRNEGGTRLNPVLGLTAGMLLIYTLVFSIAWLTR